MIRKTITMIIAGLIAGVYAGDPKPCCEMNPNYQGTGGAGGIEVGMVSLDLAPLRKVVDNEFPGKDFDFDREPIFTMSFVGYGGQKRNGTRIGVTGTFGYNAYYSDEFSTTADSAYRARTGNATVDSVLLIHAMIAHLGLIAERSFQLTENLNVYAGGMAGAGAIIAIKEGQLSGSAFRSYEPADTIDLDSTLTNTAATAAPVWAFDIHGGAMYSVTRWMHIGLDASLLMYYSSTGFGYRYGSFFTTNPGIKARIVFGNAV